MMAMPGTTTRSEYRGQPQGQPVRIRRISDTESVEFGQRLLSLARQDSAVFSRVFRSGIVPGAHQYEMALRVDNMRLHYQADFWPRDHGKSEIFCIGFPLRMICEDPNIRILIIQKTATEAEKTLQVIKTELESNRELKAFYAGHWQTIVGYRDISNASGALFRDGQREGAWQQRRIYCKRTRRGKDPTVEAVGVGGAITGGHFDIIITDDVEDDENTRTQERLETLRNWFTGTIMQLREPHTKTIVVGTLKTAGADIYNFVLNNPLWSCRTESAIQSHELQDIEYEPVYGEDGVVSDVHVMTENVKTLWPERWGIRELLMDMLASIRSIWIREKLNDLRALAGAIFKRDEFRYVEKLPARFERVVQVWDTAFEDSESTDYSVCLTAGLFHNAVYVISVFRKRLEFPALIGAIKSEYARWRPEMVLVEKKSSGHSALQVMRSETTVPVVDVDPGSQDKSARARAITPYFGGRVFFPADAEWLDAFEDQLVMFPASAHDDQVDTLVYAVMELMAGDGGTLESGNVGDDFGGYGG